MWLKNWTVMLCFFLFVSVSQGLAAPKPELWPVWQQHDPQSNLRVDYQSWSAFLKKYIKGGDDGVNRVAYDTVTSTDQKSLDTFLKDMAATPVDRLSREQQKAYWINLYNALTVKVILDHYPVESIRDIDISPGFFSDGPWGKRLVTIEGREVSLDDIEHRILRPIFQDNRLHYALNCASIGCPQLQLIPFTTANMEAMLDQAAREFINHPRAVNIDSGRLAVSSIYKWFRQDFGKNEQEVIAHLQTYAEDALGQQLRRVSSIDTYHYDWSLNRSQ